MKMEIGDSFVSFDYTTVLIGIDGDEIRYVYQVEAVVRKPRPVVLYGHPDTWAPAEGGDVEDIVVRTSTGDLVPEEFYDLLHLDFGELCEQAREIAFGQEYDDV